MLTKKEQEIKKEILEIAGVQSTAKFDSKKETRKRIDYLKSTVKESKTKGIVLGISGGVDSTTAGKLSQMAMQELRDEGYHAEFIAVRLPYKTQLDEDDAQKALSFINPDKVLNINIENGTDSLFNSVISSIYESGIKKEDMSVSGDFAKGNVKARIRMTAQYTIANLFNCLVLGTDHNAEFVAGFYTKNGDCACDLTVLNGLNKRQVRLCAKHLGAPENLWNKVATADLEDNLPQIPDEIALGFKYDEMDDFLEGLEINTGSAKKIIYQFDKTRHKREMPIGF